MKPRVGTLATALLLSAAVSFGNTYTVTSTADSGAGTLRQAILDANANPGADTIAFNITGTGPHTIAPATALDAITDPVTIDGYTQPGSSQNTNPVGQGLNTVLQIEIDGTSAPGNGLAVKAQNVTIRGLAINRFSVYQIETDGMTNTSHFAVEGCFIGTTPDGLQAIGGPGNGIDATNLDFRIGGLTPAARNLIARANLLRGGGVVEGNLIGTDATGLRTPAGVALSGKGLYLYNSQPITVGGTDPNAANVVAGFDEGMRIETPNATIQGNYFGVDAAQTGVIPSGSTGIVVILTGGTNNSKIGGTAPGEGNVIGGFDTGLNLGKAVVFQGNFVGTDTTATKNFGNRSVGVLAQGFGLEVGGVEPGEANVIAFNGWVGILVPTTHVRIRGNRIFNNGIGGVGAGGQGMAIDLNFQATPGGPTANDSGDGDSGGNDYQNFPLMTSAAPEGGGTRVIGTLNSTASTTFDLDFYANPSCRARPRALLQAEQYVGTIQVTTDASGNASFNALLPTPIDAGSPVTATATAPNGDTSELWNEIVFRATRGVGGPGDSASQSVVGQLFENGAVLTIGGNVVPSTFHSATQIDFVGPTLSPGAVYDMTVTNPSGLAGTLHNGYVSRFSDVTDHDLFDLHIAKLIANGITAGCGGGNYCTQSSVTRQQMAVFVLKSKHGICFTPPPCQGVFADVPCSSTFAPWVEQFAAEGITGGCGGGNYCPTSLVRRDQMAVFLLKGKYGSTFTPPPCAGAFPDVACPSTFADWIEELAAEGVTGGCGGGNYCPASNVTRGQMAAFLVNAFSLP
jgi:hypothetical protein